MNPETAVSNEDVSIAPTICDERFDSTSFQLAASLDGQDDLSPLQEPLLPHSQSTATKNNNNNDGSNYNNNEDDEIVNQINHVVAFTTNTFLKCVRTSVKVKKIIAAIASLFGILWATDEVSDEIAKHIHHDHPTARTRTEIITSCTI